MGADLRRVAATVLIGLASVMIVAVPAASAAAGEGPAVLVHIKQRSGSRLTYFLLQGAPGATVQAGTIQLINPTGRRVGVRLDPVDSQTTDTLGSAYDLAGQALHGSGTWIGLGSRRVHLASHASIEIPVTVVIPANATPGDYLSGIAVEALGQTSVTAPTPNVTIGSTTRYAVGVETSLPGPRHPALEITGAAVESQPSGLVFVATAHNAGNVILKNVTGSVTVTRAGHVVARQTILPGTFVTATSIRYPVRAPAEHPAPGTSYMIAAVLRYGGQTVSATRQVSYGNAAAAVQRRYSNAGPGSAAGGRGGSGWVWALVILLGLMVAGLGAYTLRLRSRSRD